MSFQNLLNRYGFNFQVVEPNVNNPLPISYKKKYLISFGRILNQLDIVCLKRNREISLEMFVEDSIYIEHRLSQRIVLIFNQLSEKDISRLISSNVSFVSEQSIFLPFAGTVIEEINQKTILRSYFTIIQQRILIHLLLMKEKTFTAQSIVKKLDIPIASVYRALKYFNELNYFESSKGIYNFNKTPFDVYADSKNYFIDPIDYSLFISRDIIKVLKNSDIHFFESGVDALSNYSELASNHNDYGISISEIQATSSKFKTDEKSIKNLYGYINKSISDKSIYNTGLFKNLNSFYSSENNIKLSVWKYKPDSIDSGQIDPITLSILKIEDNDPRVSSALEQLNEYIINLLKEDDVYYDR